MKNDCDILGYCPHNADGGYDCRNYCGLGVDVACDEEEEYKDYLDEINCYPDESMQDYPN
jgi:hypothetical protein